MEPDVRFMDRADALTPIEMTRLVSLCMNLGVRNIRITGGEPTVHPRLTEIIASIAALGPDDLAMTSNGSLCTPDKLREWRDAGLRRLTFSIDSLQPERFAKITRSSGSPEQVLTAVRDAIDVGFAPIKLNAVIVRGENDDEIADLAALARDLPVQMRFIEFMPLDSGRSWEPGKLVPATEILRAISKRWPLVPSDVRSIDPSATAETYRFADRSSVEPSGDSSSTGDIGLIAPVTRPFCSACSRLRITADGKVRPCLFSLQEWDLRDMMRQGATGQQLSRRLLDAVWSKQPGHGISTATFHQPDRPMSAIGG